MASSLSTTWASIEEIPAALEQMSREIIEAVQIMYTSRLDSFVCVQGWDGVGSATVLQYATPKIEEAVKHMKQRAGRDVLVVKVDIGREDPTSALSKIKDGLRSAGRYAFWDDAKANFLVIVNMTNYPLPQVSFDDLLRGRMGYATFVIPTVIRGGGAVVEGEFDNLSDEEALWLLRHESRCAADAVCQRNKTNSITVVVDGQPLLPILLNEVMALDCFLYCTLLPHLSHPTHCWMAEGILANYFSPQAAKLAYDLITEFQHRCMLRRSDDPSSYMIRVPEPLIRRVGAVFSLNEERRGRGIISRHSSDLLEFPFMEVEEMEKESQRYVHRISLANNQIKQIPLSLHFSECCPHLCTLLLNDNPLLDEIPDDVFSPSMPTLRLFDLSGTNITKLPSSLSNCSNLRMLSLNRCMQLETLFPIFETGLEHLEVISLEHTPLNNITKQVIPYKPNLKVLRFYSAFHELQEFNISVRDGGVFEEYSVQRPTDRYWTAPIERAHILVSSHFEDVEKRKTSSLIQNKFPLYIDVYDKINPIINPCLLNTKIACNRHLEIHGGDSNVLSYKIAHSICPPDFISLCDNQADSMIKLDVFKKLRSCRIERCHHIRTAFTVNHVETDLEHVYLSSLGNLRYMCSSIVGSLTHLSSIHISCCQNLITLFTGSNIQLPMLKELEIMFCPRLQSIFDKEIVSVAHGKSHLPALQRLRLFELPEMTRIYDGYLPMVRWLTVRGCWKLRKLQFAAIVTNTAPVIEVVVEGEPKWWNNVVSTTEFDKNKINFKTPSQFSSAFATKRRV